MQFSEINKQMEFYVVKALIPQKSFKTLGAFISPDTALKFMERDAEKSIAENYQQRFEIYIFTKDGSLYSYQSHN